MINVTYNGNNTIYLQDKDESDTMKGSLLDCFKSACSWAKDGEEINFHIKTNTSENEIHKLKNHIEKRANGNICKEGDNKHRIKIKVEYSARNIIKNIYYKYNKPSTYQMMHISQEETIEEEDDYRKQIFNDEEEFSLQDLL